MKCKCKSKCLMKNPEKKATANGALARKHNKRPSFRRQTKDFTELFKSRVTGVHRTVENLLLLRLSLSPVDSKEGKEIC